VSGPIFVGGLERTGTSLIYALLASHPNIAMSRRTNWWTFFYRRFGDLGHDANLDRCLATMARYRRHRKLQPDFDRLRREFVAGPRDYGRLFALLEAQHAERLGKPRWGDKSLHTERYAEAVFSFFPDARILHMVRDPRDRYASVLKRWQRVRGGVGAATAMWLYSIALGERNVSRWPDRYRLVHYEELATRPEPSLRDISAFIGEPYEPQMLRMGGAEDFRDQGGNSSYGEIPVGTISTASIGRYPQMMRPGEIAFMQRLAGPAMRRHGYAPEAVRLAGIDRLRHLVVETPANLAIMAGWRGRELVRDVTGRKPSSHTIVERELDAETAGPAPAPNE
jgi:sulfotransferase family protein